jgi:acyl-homoserine-lactone acylase
MKRFNDVTQPATALLCRALRPAVWTVLVTVLASCSVLPLTLPGRTPEPPPPPMVVDAVDPRVELLWDSYGVPHIFADDETALFYAYGWAQMRSHGDLILRLFAQARGRGAEFGGERFVEADVWTRTNGIPQRADAWLAEQSPHIRAYLDAFVLGMNEFARQNPDAIGDAWRQVLPIQPADPLAHQQRVLNFTFMANPAIAAAVQRQWPVVPGSNAWAIGPDRSSSRNTLLLGNPHLPWSDLFTWYEAHLSAPGLNAYGAGLIGMPTLAIAFNEHLGWTHTVNTYDGADLYELTLSADGYVFDGELRAFDVEQQSLLVLQADGTHATRPLTVRRSVHGPVIAERDGRAIALRVAGLDRPHLLDQYIDMMRATSRSHFEAALARLQMPMFTVMYADRAGNIMHVFNGVVPVRPRGDWRYWQGAVRGDSSSTLWTQAHSYGALPRVLNPPTGWLQNANDPPWTTTIPFVLDPRLFPPYMAPELPMAFRPQRSARMLMEDNRITFEELVAYKYDARMEAADHLVQDVVAAARVSGDEYARAAADVLERWDRTALAQSRGGVLFVAFLRALYRERWPTGTPFEVPWTATAPLATPDGLADPRRAVTLLGETARAVRERYGTLEVAWGDVYRLQRDTLDLPASGGPGEAGVFRVLDFAPLAADSTRFAAVGGDSYILAVEFAEPVRAMTLLAYGNASQPGSPHRTDQLALYARHELRPVWFTRAEVLPHVLLREAF